MLRINFIWIIICFWFVCSQYDLYGQTDVKKFKIVPVHFHTVSDFAYSHDGNLIATIGLAKVSKAGEFNTVKLWDAMLLKPFMTWDINGECIDFHPDNKSFFVGENKSTIYQISTITYEIIKKINYEPEMWMHTNSVKVSEDGRYLLITSSGYGYSRVFVYDLYTNTVVKRINNKIQQNNKPIFSAKGDLFYLWDKYFFFNTKLSRFKLPKYKTFYGEIRILVDKNILLVLNHYLEHYIVSKIDLKKGKKIKEIEYYTDAYWYLNKTKVNVDVKYSIPTISPDGKYLCIVNYEYHLGHTANNYITLIDINELEVISQFMPDEMGIFQSISYIPENGLRAFTERGNNNIVAKSFDVINKTTIREVQQNTASFNSGLKLSDDNRYVWFKTNKREKIIDLKELKIYPKEQVDKLNIVFKNKDESALIQLSNDYFISTSGEGTIELYDKNKIDSSKLTFVANPNSDDWLIYNAQNYWDASKDGGDMVALLYNNKLYGIDQVALTYNRPDILLKNNIYKNYEVEDFYNKLYNKRKRKINAVETISELPVVNITNTKIEDKFITIDFSILKTNAEIKSYNVFMNDIPVYGAIGKEITSNTTSFSDKIELQEGMNKIEISCMTRGGAESFRAQTNASYKKKVAHNLYLLAFGVSKYNNSALNLRYAHKDALDLEKVMQSLTGKGFENVYTKVLVNEQVTPEAIKAAKDFVKNAKVDDTFVLFIAGHGLHDRDAEATYYYLTSNADINNLKGTAADFETIEDLLQGIPPRNKLFLMDACESGEIDDDEQGQMIAVATGVGIASRGFKSSAIFKQGNFEKKTAKRTYLYQKDRYIYNDLVRRSGAIVFSSSKGGELSYERSDIENGLFTEYIMRALTTTEADKDQNGIVSTDELRQYVSEQVAKASGDLQHPTVDRDNIYQSASGGFGFVVK